RQSALPISTAHATHLRQSPRHPNRSTPRSPVTRVLRSRPALRFRIAHRPRHQELPALSLDDVRQAGGPERATGIRRTVSLTAGRTRTTATRRTRGPTDRAAACRDRNMRGYPRGRRHARAIRGNAAAHAGTRPCRRTALRRQPRREFAAQSRDPHALLRALKKGAHLRLAPPRAADRA